MTTDFRTAVRLAVADEARLRASLAESDIAPMLMVLVQLGGNVSFSCQVIATAFQSYLVCFV